MNRSSPIRLTLLTLLLPCALPPTTRAKDVYGDFAALRAACTEGECRVRSEDRASSIAVFAIHGGNIEPGTSQAALAVAGRDLSYYLFECAGTFETCRRLHVTSARFDDPAAVSLATSSVLAVSLHGSKDSTELVCVGGANSRLRVSVAATLKASGIPVEEPCRRLPGSTARNIVNRSREGGVQLEISVPLAKRLEKDPDFAKTFGAAVRAGLPVPRPAWVDRSSGLVLVDGERTFQAVAMATNAIIQLRRQEARSGADADLCRLIHRLVTALVKDYVEATSAGTPETHSQEVMSPEFRRLAASLCAEARLEVWDDGDRTSHALAAKPLSRVRDAWAASPPLDKGFNGFLDRHIEAVFDRLAVEEREGTRP